jgi:hypothetical protein
MHQEVTENFKFNSVILCYNTVYEAVTLPSLILTDFIGEGKYLQICVNLMTHLHQQPFRLIFSFVVHYLV